MYHLLANRPVNVHLLVRSAQPRALTAGGLQHPEPGRFAADNVEQSSDRAEADQRPASAVTRAKLRGAAPSRGRWPNPPPPVAMIGPNRSCTSGWRLPNPPPPVAIIGRS
jgi:hypothetical protein